MDGEDVVVSLDMSAANLAAADGVEEIREKCREVCGAVGAVAVLFDGIAVPLTAPPAVE